MDSGNYTEQSWMDESGGRLVLETNWHRVDGPRCQMIWERQSGGGVLITTCNKDVPPIRFTAEQCATVAYFLRLG